MHSLPSRFLLTAGLVVILPASVQAQKPWIDPEPPCEVSQEHRLVNNAVARLQQAVESEDREQRDSKLIEARDFLVQAIVEDGQTDNPAVWYFLGRYYAEAQDAAGVDSAFRKAEALASECTDDINIYRTPISAVAMNDAAIAWQAGQVDSAAVLFRLAYSIDRGNANALLFLASMYAGAAELDSASKYVRLGGEAAGDNPSFQSRRKRAMLDVARAYAKLTDNEPAVGRAAQARWTRDSLAYIVERDSTILADLIAEWAGRRLRPEVQARVSRDSGRVAERLAAARSAYATARPAAENDSLSALRVLRSPIEVYTQFASAFPDDRDAIRTLITYQAAVGDRSALNSAIDRLANAPGGSSVELIQTGLALLNTGSPDGAIRALEAVTTVNPNARDALILLARAHYQLRHAAPLMEVAKRLVSIDPLNQQSVRMMAAAWELAGQRDSTNKYVQLANSGIGWQVSVSQFLPSEGSTVLNGTVSNITRAAQPAGSLVFEFLDGAGNVVSTATTDVPGLAPGAQHRIALSVDQGGAVAWRYRKG